jgi:hypothetical protein
MLNTISKLEVKIGERVYQLLCQIDSPIGEVHDALSQMKLFVINRMKEVEISSQEASSPKQEEKE